MQNVSDQANQVIGKTELIRQIASKSGMSISSVQKVLDEVFQEIAHALVQGRKVSLKGFGSFEPVLRKAREGVNPKTGERLSVPASIKPRFSASKALKDDMQKPDKQ